MTIDEAIQHCEEVAQENEKQYSGCPMKYDGAYANNGKSACKCAKEHRQLAEWLKELKQLREQEPCEDAISRQAVLDGLASIAKAKAKSDAQKALMGRVMFFTEHLPPVTSQPKVGHWILADEQNKEDVENDNYRFICSECQYSDIHAKGTLVPYCWKCGAKMVESQESEDKE